MVVIVGMGRSGLAVSRLLASRGIEVFASEALSAPPLLSEFADLGLDLEVGGHSVDRFTRAEEIVVSPGVSPHIEALQLARDKGVPVVSELEVASRYLRGDIVAVTGSNGKTTTTSLVGAILGSGPRPVQIGGNIGIAASELVDGSTEDTINVLEVSSFQLEGTVKFRPHVAALLNVTPDHLDRYQDFEAYRMAKFNLFRNQTAEDYAVLNRDDPQSFPQPVPIAARRCYFGGTDAPDVVARAQGDSVLLRDDLVIRKSDLPLRGAHNVENVLAAILIADVYGIGSQAMASAIRQFKGVEHRLETVATVDGVEFVNDSKATNVESAIKALESFSGNIILILGGKDKGTSFAPLVETMEGRVRQAFTLGVAAEKLEREIGSRVETRRVQTMREAVELAFDIARRGDVVLLAPACASLDMYANYEERGRDFKNAVQSHLKVMSRK